MTIATGIPKEEKNESSSFIEALELGTGGALFNVALAKASHLRRQDMLWATKATTPKHQRNETFK